MRTIILSIMLLPMLLTQVGCSPLAFAASAFVIKIFEREQQNQQIILRNAEYHLKRGEHLDLLAKHGIYPQEKQPEVKTNKVVVVKQEASPDSNNKDETIRTSTSDKATVQKAEVALQDTSRQLQEICDKAIQTRQNLLAAKCDGNTELLKNSNGGKQNVNE